MLNSLYGALLNEIMKFSDKRIGKSVTLTGRCVAKHMNSKINEIIVGKYDYKGDAIIYADTDSSYFSAYSVLKDDPNYADFEWSRNNIIDLYKGIEGMVNESFPGFMMENFNTTLARGQLIKAGLELVASKGLFIKKKKYAVMQYYKDGKRLDKNESPGKMKVMGLDMKRADTPKIMQSFLEKLLKDLLVGVDKAVLFAEIKKFRKEFVSLDGWEKGTPKKVNALSDYVERRTTSNNILDAYANKRAAKTAHVEAAVNWNKLCETYGDRYSSKIGDGAKVVVCKLKPNLMKIKEVAYPIDEPHLPKWFKHLDFDHVAMEQTIIDMKLKNLVGVLNWDLEMTKDKPGDDFFIFSS